MRVALGAAAVEGRAILVDVILRPAAHEVLELLLAHVPEAQALASGAHGDPLHHRPVEGQLAVGRGQLGRDVGAGDIIPQPMSKPTGPIATAPSSRPVRITQPTGTP